MGRNDRDRVDGTERRFSRRSFLAGGIGGMAALAVQVLARAQVAAAANGDPVLAGETTTATAATAISTSSGNGIIGSTSALAHYGVYGESTGTDINGAGIYGTSTHGEGVWGNSVNRYGVMGVSESSTHAGVYGFNDFGGAAVTGEVQDGGGYGVHGMTSSDTKAAVFGENAGTGAGVTGSGPSRGVHGTSSGGIGVLADGATALQVNGPAVFSRSGLVTIPSGQTSGKVTNVALTSASLVLAAVQAKGPSYVKQVALQPSTSSFTVYVNKTRTDTPVAWFIVN